MKKMFAIAALAVMMSGCSMAHEQVVKHIKACESRGGTPLIFRFPSGTVEKVRCEIDGNVYLMGDY